MGAQLNSLTSAVFSCKLCQVIILLWSRAHCCIIIWWLFALLPSFLICNCSFVTWIYFLSVTNLPYWFDWYTFLYFWIRKAGPSKLLCDLLVVVVVVVVVVISSPKIPKAFLIHSATKVHMHSCSCSLQICRLRFSAVITQSFLWSKFISCYRFETWNWTFTKRAAELPVYFHDVNSYYFTNQKCFEICMLPLIVSCRRICRNYITVVSCLLL